MRPHDAADLALAPVALELDARIEELGALSHDDLVYRVVLESSVDTHTRDMRERGFLVTVGYLIDLHGWEIALVDRGLELSHGEHRLVLGLPERITQFIEG